MKLSRKKITANKQHPHFRSDQTQQRPNLQLQINKQCMFLFFYCICSTYDITNQKHRRLSWSTQNEVWEDFATQIKIKTHHTHTHTHTHTQCNHLVLSVCTGTWVTFGGQITDEVGQCCINICTVSWHHSSS